MESVKISVLKDVPVKVKVVTTAIGITDKTYRSYMSREQELPPVQGEWVMKYKEVQQFGVDLFGSEAAFDAWMDKHSTSLKDVPKNLLYSVRGVQDIVDELTRIAHGYPA